MILGTLPQTKGSSTFSSSFEDSPSARDFLFRGIWVSFGVLESVDFYAMFFYTLRPNEVCSFRRSPGFF